jgi:hypothetical protein
MMTDEPLFPSLSAALRFAFAPQSPAYQAPVLGRWQVARGSRTSAIGALSRQDRSTQAALLLSFLARQPATWQAWVAAAYGSGALRSGGMWALARFAAPQMRGEVSARVAYDLVRRRFGAGMFLADLAERHGCHANTMGHRAREIEALLSALEEQAQEGMAEELVHAGVIVAR